MNYKNDLMVHRNATHSFRFVSDHATARGFASVKITAHPGTINSYIICKLWLMIIIIFDSNVTNVTFATLMCCPYYSWTLEIISPRAAGLQISTWSNAMTLWFNNGIICSLVNVILQLSRWIFANYISIYFSKKESNMDVDVILLFFVFVYKVD